MPASARKLIRIVVCARNIDSVVEPKIDHHIPGCVFEVVRCRCYIVHVQPAGADVDSAVHVQDELRGKRFTSNGVAQENAIQNVLPRAFQGRVVYFEGQVNVFPFVVPLLPFANGTVGCEKFRPCVIVWRRRCIHNRRQKHSY